MLPGPWLTIPETLQAMKQGRGRGVKIAILDSGVEDSHPAFEGLKLMDDLVFDENAASVQVEPGHGQDLYGHGTAICSVLRRVAPEAQVGSFRILQGNLRGRPELARAAASAALERGYHILNCSFGLSHPDWIHVYQSWTSLAYQRRTHVVAASNNLDAFRVEYPASLASVIGVTIAPRCQEEQLRIRTGVVIEMGAHGEDVDVAWLGGGRKLVTGSSYAAAYVSGLLARLLSCYPSLDPWTAKAVLRLVASPWV
jgi:subtilisin family serine protease